MSTATEYRELLMRTLPRPIRTERDHRRALAQLEQIMDLRPSAAQSMLIELMSSLIEQFESREHPTPTVSPAQMLAHLLEAKAVSCAQVAKATGIPPATLSNVLADRRGVSKANAVKLAKYFRVSPTAFLSDASPAKDATDA